MACSKLQVLCYDIIRHHETLLTLYLFELCLYSSCYPFIHLQNTLFYLDPVGNGTVDKNSTVDCYDCNTVTLWISYQTMMKESSIFYCSWTTNRAGLGHSTVNVIKVKSNN